LEHSNDGELELLRSRDNDGCSAVHHLRHSAECYTELLERGADVNAADNNGMTPLAFYLSESFYPSETVVELLLSQGASVGHTFSKTEMGLGHLHAAKCLKLNTGILKLLAVAGLDLKDTNGQGRTILHHAAITGSLTEQGLQYLANNAGLSLGTGDNTSRTALDYATQRSGKKHHRNVFDCSR
jgi:ankyrin repeat protein